MSIEQDLAVDVDKKSIPESITPSSQIDSVNKVLWTQQTEELLKQWGDISACYKWLHDQSFRKYKRINYWYSIPIIILSTVAGTLNVSLAGYVPPAYLNYAQAGIGAMNIFTGVLTTLQSFFSYAQLSESHNNAAMGWSKMHRNIIIELNLEQQFRTDADRFLRDCRRDYDRLLEQSPPIPTEIINLFKNKFKTNTDLIQPDICDNITHTEVYRYISPSYTPIEKQPDEKINVVSLEALKDILVDESQQKRRHTIYQSSYYPPAHTPIKQKPSTTTVKETSFSPISERPRASSMPEDLPQNKGAVKNLIKRFTNVEQVITMKRDKIIGEEEKVQKELPDLKDPTLVVEESLILPTETEKDVISEKKEGDVYYKYVPGMLMTSSFLNAKQA